MPKRLALIAVTLAALALVIAHAPSPPRSTVALGSMGHGPAVVLVHGLGSGAEHWLPVARNLSAIIAEQRDREHSPLVCSIER